MEAAKSSGHDASSLPWVLVAEDDDNDFFFLQRAVAKATSAIHVVRAANGEEAIQHLQDNLARPPMLIITDLKMPGVDGFGLLAWLKANPQLREVPIFIWSGSELPKDRDKARSLEARLYYSKGLSHSGLPPLVAEVCRIIPPLPGIQEASR